MKFEDLKLGYGYPLQLQVQVEGQVQRATSKLVGCVPGQGLLIAPPRGKARLRSGQKIVVRIMVGNGICLFPALIQSVVTQPMPMMPMHFYNCVDLILLFKNFKCEADEKGKYAGMLSFVAALGFSIEFIGYLRYKNQIQEQIKSNQLSIAGWDMSR